MMTKILVTVIVFAGVFAVAGAVVLANVLVHGWALTLLWNWYAVPFAGAPPLSIPMGIGLTALVAVILGQRGLVGPKDPEEKEFVRVLTPFVRPLLAVLIGWIARGYL